MLPAAKQESLGSLVNAQANNNARDIATKLKPLGQR
jgi:hypothetical protein